MERPIKQNFVPLWRVLLVAAYAFGLFHFAIITCWLQDSSRGKERTLALLDRSLKTGDSILKIADSLVKRRSWKW